MSALSAVLRPKAPWALAPHVLFAAMHLGACSHAVRPHSVPLCSRPPVQAAQDALERAHHGPAMVHAPELLKQADATVHRAAAKAAEKGGGPDADDLAYLGRRQVQLAESQSGKAIANLQAGQAYEALQQLQENGNGAEVGQLVYARRPGSFSATALHEGPWEQQPGLGLVLPLLGDKLFAEHVDTLTPKAYSALDQVAQALAGENQEVGVLPVGQAGIPQRLVAARSQAICAYLMQAGLQVSPMAQVPPGLGPDAGRAENTDLWLIVLVPGP